MTAVSLRLCAFQQGRILGPACLITDTGSALRISDHIALTLEGEMSQCEYKHTNTRHDMKLIPHMLNA